MEATGMFDVPAHTVHKLIAGSSAKGSGIAHLTVLTRLARTEKSGRTSPPLIRITVQSTPVGSQCFFTDSQ